MWPPSLIVAQMTGGLQALSSVAVIAGVAITPLVTAIDCGHRNAGVFGVSIAAATAAIVGVIAAVVALIAIWPQLSADAVATWEQIKTASSEFWSQLSAMGLPPGPDVWQWLIDTIQRHRRRRYASRRQSQKVARSIWVTTPIANAWQWIADTFNAALMLSSPK